MVTHHGQARPDGAAGADEHSNQQASSTWPTASTKTQFGEIQAFNAWLVQWPEGQNSDPAGHDAAGHGATMPGMVDAATMARLQSLTGPDFDRLWLTSMIDHHRGAIAMAQDEIAHGKNPDVIYLARTIIAGQQAEIDQMKQMLGG